jgi:sarcosine reductase
MRLELGTFPVTEMKFGASISWSDGTLEIDRDGLLAEIRKDPRITSASLEIARPGDSVRITTVRDVLEPRVKISGPGTVYPGICGRPVATVGSGRTHRLAGVGVVEVAAVPLYLNPGMGGYVDRALIDMRGNGDQSPAFSRLQNLCVVLEVNPDLHVHDRNEAAHSAALLVSDTLAESTRNLEPPELETFELQDVDPSLPKVAYIMCQHSPEHHAGSVRGWGDHLYGITRLHPPWVIHPNEMLDGALTFDNSWGFVNNPMLLEMYRRHGVDLNFTGCIVIRTRWSSQSEKDVTSRQAAKTARMLGADGVVVVGMVGGNDFMEAVRTSQACELEGLATTFVVLEDEPSDGGPTILEPLPEVRSIVSVGVGRKDISPGTVPAVDRVIGPTEITLDLSTGIGKIDAKGELPFFRSGLVWTGLESQTSCFEF